MTDTTPTIEIRPARADDAAMIAEFNARMAHETEALTLDRAILDAGVRAALADPNKARYFVADAGGKVVGQLMITLEWSDWRNGEIWWIQSVYVHVDYRGRGPSTGAASAAGGSRSRYVNGTHAAFAAFERYAR